MSGFIKCPNCDCKISIDVKVRKVEERMEGEQVTPSIEDRILRKLASKGTMKIRKIIHTFQHERSVGEIRQIMCDLADAKKVEMIELIPPRGPGTVAYRCI